MVKEKEDLVAADAQHFPQLLNNVTFWLADMMRFSTDKDAREHANQCSSEDMLLLQDQQEEEVCHYFSATQVTSP